MRTKLLLLAFLSAIGLTAQDTLRFASSDIKNVHRHLTIDSQTDSVFSPDRGLALRRFRNDSTVVEIYRDANRKELLTRMFAKGDSCYSRHYYPNGQLRLYFIEAGEDFTSLVYSEAYYSNGQLSAKLDYGPKDLELSTSYWQNGNKQGEYLWSPWGWGTIVGDYQVWHENGQPHIKGQFSQCTFAQLIDRSCESKEQGTWTYWFQDGRVEKVINYKDGVEVK